MKQFTKVAISDLWGGVFAFCGVDRPPKEVETSRAGAREVNGWSGQRFWARRSHLVVEVGWFRCCGGELLVGWPAAGPGRLFLFLALSTAVGSSLSVGGGFQRHRHGGSMVEAGFLLCESLAYSAMGDGLAGFFFGITPPSSGPALSTVRTFRRYGSTA